MQGLCCLERPTAAGPPRAPCPRPPLHLYNGEYCLKYTASTHATHAHAHHQPTKTPPGSP
eukprot:scaffold73425_cov24-Tisochrysis_lutea.AAC.1